MGKSLQFVSVCAPGTQRHKSACVRHWGSSVARYLILGSSKAPSPSPGSRMKQGVELG